MLLDEILQKWRMVKAMRHIPKHARVLDVGSGNGRLFQLLGDHITEGIGIDPLLAEPISHANYSLVPGNFPTQVPKGKLFDAITMLAVIEHFPEDLLQHCNEICRDLLHDGGLVIITVPSRYVDTILSILKLLRLVDAHTLDEHHGFEVSMINEIFSCDSFELIYRKHFQLGLNNLFVFKKKRWPRSS